MTRFRAALLVAITSAACGQATPPPAKLPAVKKPAVASAVEVDPFMPRFVPALRVLPDVDDVRTIPMVEARAVVTERSIVGRMRVELQPGGKLARADEIFPIGRVFAENVPRRLGGGFLFLVITAMGSQLFRSDTWLGTLQPLTTIGQAPDQDRPLVMGFDRVFVRLRSSGDLYPINPTSGAPMTNGPLPTASGYGAMVFLDAYTAIVDTDFVGPQVTFDAGTTWSRLPIADRVRTLAPEHADDERARDAIIGTDAGSFRMNPRGEIERIRTPVGPQAVGVLSTLRAGARPSGDRPGPLGKRPLRTLLASGVPDSATTAVTLHEGQLCRVSLESGALLKCEKTAVDPLADCHGIALGDPANETGGAGFVCGQSTQGTAVVGSTTLLRLGDDLAVTEVMRFNRPRIVVESGQGNVVIHGPCSDDPAPAETRPFCVRFADDTSREVRLRGSGGGERIVAMRDKTVVIIVPPRPGSHGQLTLLGEGAPKHIALSIPEGSPRDLDTGLWMEGFHQSAEDEVAGWIEGGGPIMGVRVKISGEVTVEPAVEDADGVIVAGRFGLRLGSSGSFAETMDTGKTWTDIVVPEMPRSEAPADRLRCGAVGCLLPGAFKIGWGVTATVDDLRIPDPPATAPISNMTLTGAPRPLTCTVAKGVSKPATKKTKARREDEPHVLGTAHTAWGPLGPVAAPPLDKGQAGIDVGANFEAVPARVYVWGERDTDWARTGRMLLRFGDRFSLNEVHSSSVTTSFWANEGDALAALGQVGGGLSWQASLDDQSVLVSGCRGDRGCLLFATAANQSIVNLRMSDDAPVPRPQNGAVRVGSSWFFFGETRGDDFKLFRADLGTVREVAKFRRATLGRGGPPPKLIRKARSLGVGIMFTARQGPGDRRGERFVLPLDVETGAVGEPESLGRADFGLMEFHGCGERDGWVVEATIEGQDVLVDGRDIDTRGVELRMRMRNGRACAESGVFRPSYDTIDDSPSPAPKTGKPSETPPAGAFPLITYGSASLPLGLTCVARP